MTDRHRLFALGSNGSGQLGIGHKQDVSMPQECVHDAVLGSRRIKQLAAGGNHSVMLFDDGNVIATGDNSDGRCWTVSEKNTERWSSRMKPLSVGGGGLEYVAATWSASFGSTAGTSSTATSGSGGSGELGLGRDVIATEVPRRIEDFKPRGTRVVKLASCMGHVTVVLSNGEVWGWGKGRKGQLGMPHENVWEPRKIEGIPFFAVDAVCGKDFTCVFGHPASGELALLGPNGNDRFGIKADAPASIPGWNQVAASWGSIYVLMQSGELVSWGRDDHGQLPPPNLPPLESIATGSEHCLGLTKAGKVLAWGWGEHGNCGIPTDESGDVRGRCNEIPMSHPVTAVFAGCATSFIVTKSGREEGV